MHAPSYFPLPTTNLELLGHIEVANAICAVLLAYGYSKQDVEDGRQDVYLKVLAAFDRGRAVPEDLGGMKALCAEVARNHAIDRKRAAAKRRRDFVGNCDPDEYTPLHYGAAQRDPVDAGRQLEVLASLFREGLMPKDGVDILEGVASRCTYAEIGQDLGISEDAVDRRLRTMRKAFRRRMVKLGMLPDMIRLELVVSNPDAIAKLREVA